MSDLAPLSHAPARWLNALAGRLPYGRWVCGAGLFSVVLFVYWLAGMFDADVNRERSPISAPLFFAAVVAYVVPVFDYIYEHARATSGQLQRTGLQRADMEFVDPMESAAPTVTLVLLGVVCGLVHDLALADFDLPRLQSNFLHSVASASILIGAVVVWVVLTVISGYLVAIAMHFRELGRTVRIDLLDRSTVTPFSSFAVTSTLAVLGAIAVFPILWFGNESAVKSMLPGVIALMIPVFVLLVLPMAPVHARMSQLKAAELARTQQRINELQSPWGVEQPDLAPLAEALTYRREVQQISEWPIDLGNASRFGFYLVIPPATWVGAALIENLVDLAL